MGDIDFIYTSIKIESERVSTMWGEKKYIGNW